ncbi:MAG: LamG-like jellyroll fold domain-containing protein [Bacteroidota bacterium]
MKTNRLLILSFLWVLFSNVSTAQDINLGLQTYYSFDNNSTLDSTDNQLHGIGANILAAPGVGEIDDSAVQFNGTDSEIYCGTDNRQILDQLTISVWVKTLSFERDLFISKYNSDEGAGYFMAIDDGFAIIGGRDGGDEFYQAISEVRINDGQWHHLVGMVDNNDWRIYVDCQESGRLITNTSFPDLRTMEPLSLGYWHQGNGLGDFRHYNGLLDEVRIYNRPLEINEVELLCNAFSTNTEEIDNREEVQLFPNPANEVLHLSKIDDLLAGGQYQIFSASGALVQNGRLERQILIEQIPEGWYVFQLRNREGYEQNIPFLKAR